VQGVAGSGQDYGDPRAAARAFADAGAAWLHLVDLDAAFGRGDNRSVLSDVIASTDLHVELSGGLRDDDAIAWAMGTGCRRVNIGTAALENPDWCAEVIAAYGDRVAIGLDVRGDRLAARGWVREGGELLPTLRRLDEAGCARYVVTDVAKDGMLAGPNLDLLRLVCRHTDAPVIASGGVTTVDDIRAVAALAPLGVEGVIVGTALYKGDLDIIEALAIAPGR
jgi:1-(5-phosphoribosyl)-5-[(5-phosphoribosylamino)methylideneamino] imidazole-4-carboxamide isomerase/N-(5'phosphoribosyl)anthranilate isomerase